MPQPLSMLTRLTDDTGVRLDDLTADEQTALEELTAGAEAHERENPDGSGYSTTFFLDDAIVIYHCPDAGPSSVSVITAA